ncbi:hypothetical protein M5K25_001279 [Dendrobium thyrsiflorum]|uniref:Uncharacterized protein n=1 Tax=Dendrobium thyrsiflorum TaxID=117978 RepID=A0ABD0VQ31_DENTH
MFLLVERGPGSEQGMPPVQSQGKASTEIKGRIKAKVVDLISAVHSNHSEITPDLSLIYESCHSQKSINRALISPREGPKGRRRRREEKKERREETPPRPPPDFPPASKRRRSSARPPSDAGLPPGLQATPEFRPASKDPKQEEKNRRREGRLLLDHRRSPPDHRLTPEFRRITTGCPIT